MNKKQLSLIAIVFIIILAVIFVGQRIFKKQQQIIAPPSSQQNFLQQNSLPKNGNVDEIIDGILPLESSTTQETQ